MKQRNPFELNPLPEVEFKPLEPDVEKKMDAVLKPKVCPVCQNPFCPNCGGCHICSLNRRF